MTKVQIEEVVDHLSSEFRRALEETMKEHFPNQNFDSFAVFRTFKRQVYRKCNVWETVPDRYVKTK